MQTILPQCYIIGLLYGDTFRSVKKMILSEAPDVGLDYNVA